MVLWWQKHQARHEATLHRIYMSLLQALGFIVYAALDASWQISEQPWPIWRGWFQCSDGCYKADSLLAFDDELQMKDTFYLVDSAIPSLEIAMTIMVSSPRKSVVEVSCDLQHESLKISCVDLATVLSHEWHFLEHIPGTPRTNISQDLKSSFWCLLL